MIQNEREEKIFEVMRTMWTKYPEVGEETYLESVRIEESFKWLEYRKRKKWHLLPFLHCFDLFVYLFPPFDWVPCDGKCFRNHVLFILIPSVAGTLKIHNNTRWTNKILNHLLICQHTCKTNIHNVLLIAAL